MKRTRKINHGKFVQCPDEFIALGFTPMDCRIIGTVLSLSKKKGYCYASTSKIAYIVNTSVRVVQKYLKKLIEQGVIIKKIVIDKCGDSKRQLIINNDIISKNTNKDAFAINEQMFVESEQTFVKNEQKFVENEQKFADLTPQKPDNHGLPEPKFAPDSTVENKREQQSTETNPPQAQNSTSPTSSPNAAAAFSDENELMNRLRDIGVSESKALGLVKKVCDDNDSLTASMLMAGIELIANDSRINRKAGCLLSLVNKGELGDYIDRKQKEQQTQVINPSVEDDRDFKNVDHKFTYLIKDHDLSEKTDREVPQSFIFNLTALLDRYPHLTRPTLLTATLNGEYVNLPGLRKKYQGIGAGQTPPPTIEIKTAPTSLLIPNY